MKFTLISLFPDFYDSPLKTSIIGRAIKNNLIEVGTVNLRDFASNKHNRVDDKPYGGGPGMVMMAPPIKAALKASEEKALSQKRSVRKILLTPQGKVFNQARAREFANFGSGDGDKDGNVGELIIFSGRYEGVDERVRESFDEEISLGDFIMTGAEIASLALIDSVARLLPGVLGDEDSITGESFEEATGGLLEYPQYTKPDSFEGCAVPKVLLSGNHGEILKWRRFESIKRTYLRRPDLIKESDLTDKEKEFLEDLKLANLKK